MPTVASFPPPDHEDRRLAADEVHARPPDIMTAPLRAMFVAVVVAPADRKLEADRVAALCRRFDVSPPEPDATHFRTSLGTTRFKWERRTEFSTFTFIEDGASPADTGAAPTGFPSAPCALDLPGRTVVAAHAELIADIGGDDDRGAPSESPFDANEIAGSVVGDGAAVVLTDFRIGPDRWVRFVVRDRSLTPRQAGRTVQRLFDIEAYRVMALLAFPTVRNLAPRIAEIETSLDALTGAIAKGSNNDETLLAQLTERAAEVEHIRASVAARLSASTAYHELVTTRIRELREERFAGVQTIGEFMTRRLTPAMATCASLSRRLRDLSERIAQANGLLLTRVEIVRERQNQALLASMDRRATLQLRLQHTVEWLSVAAVTYYSAALVGYIAKALRHAGVGVDPDYAAGAAIPVLGLLVALTLYRARRASK